jgi:hypothetical protein
VVVSEKSRFFAASAIGSGWTVARDGEGEAGAQGVILRESKVAAEGAGEASAEGEAEADAGGGPGGVMGGFGEWAEQAASRLGRKAGAVVADRQGQPAAGR